MKMIEGFNYLFGNLFNKQNARLNFSLNYLQRQRAIVRNYMDYIRLSSLELVADDINNKNLVGAVAELGVYKGKFACYINKYFPDRKLYLFDTFKGFDEKDVSAEIQNTYSSGAQDFSNTSIKQVMDIMPHPENC